jgi:Leucine-rich repeat (LRR) protein
MSKVTFAATFDSIKKALLFPEAATQLVLQGNHPDIKHLSPGLGKLIHLRILKLQCMEALVDLPPEIGNLTELEQIIMDNGNGCTMNVSLPESIGLLRNLKILVLKGAIDPREVGPDSAIVSPERIKKLPDALGKLEQLEVLDLARNGLTAIPPQVATLKNLRVLRLEYNDIRAIPDFVGMLDKLKELSLQSNGKDLHLPDSLARLKDLRLDMGNAFLSLQDQQTLRARFPNVLFSFENEYDDDAANEEPAQP